MARPLRIVRAGAWYHITARGNERRDIFLDDRDRLHFYELLDELTLRFALKIHAFVLMSNHYHLLIELSQLNLSRAIQWLNTSYSLWFNRRHHRCGHLLQGRFKAIIVDPIAWGVALSRYIHLNPIRTSRLRLGKTDRQRARTAAFEPPAPALVRGRLAELRRYRWSSFGAYSGNQTPRWLCTQDILDLAGAKGPRAHARYRLYVEEAVRNGLPQSPWEELTAQVILGGEQFVRTLRRKLLPAEKRTPASSRPARTPLNFAKIVAAVEKACRTRWADIRHKHADINRDLALYLARRYSGLTLKQLAHAAKMNSGSAVAIAVQRFAKKLTRPTPERKQLQRLCQMLNVQL